MSPPSYRPRICAVCTLGVAEWLAPLHSSLARTSRACAYTQQQPFSTTDSGQRHLERTGRKNPRYGSPSHPKPKHEWNRLSRREPSGAPPVLRDPRIEPQVNIRSAKYVSSPDMDYPVKPAQLPRTRIPSFSRNDPSQDPHALPPRISRTSISPRKPATKYSVFENLILEQFREVMWDLKWSSPRQRALVETWGINSETELKGKAFRFKLDISRSFEQAEQGLTNKEDNFLYHRLRSAFVGGDVRGLRREVQGAFMTASVDLKFSDQETANQKRVADLRYPVEWFPATRAIQRTVHLHVGPTNSGKTYRALQALEAAKTGVYAGPLRLLAHEVYTRFNAKGKLCALVTGEERRFPEGLKTMMSSCTVEMVPLNSKVDVAVIDEIQMMADESRGWAWTQAFLGVQAKELHLCGEARTVPLIKELCAETGDKLEIHEYNRLSPLETSKKHLGSLKNLEKGDAVITFSRLELHGLKSEIEKATGRRCAIVYGSLPPETRAQQANLFNDQDNEFDFLVASDAIGMGLNLAIKRVIFESTAKRNGAGGFEVLDNSSIKQIGGRAGRYRTAHDAVQGALTDGVEDADASHSAVKLGDSRKYSQQAKELKQSSGYVTTIDKFDLEIVTKAMNAEIEPLKQAGIFPPNVVINRFASLFPAGTPFSYIVLRLHELASTNPRFKISRITEQIEIVDAIQGYPLTTNDRIIFMASPAPLRDPGVFEAVQEMAQCVAEQSGGELLELKSLKLELLEVNLEDYRGDLPTYLRDVESLHKIITLYLWLSYRFTGVFRSQALAFHAKSLVEERIDLCLQEVNWDEGQRQRSAQRRTHRLKQSAFIADERSAGVEQNPPTISDGEHSKEQQHVQPLNESRLESVQSLEETGVSRTVAIHGL